MTTGYPGGFETFQQVCQYFKQFVAGGDHFLIYFNKNKMELLQSQVKGWPV